MFMYVQNTYVPTFRRFSQSKKLGAKTRIKRTETERYLMVGHEKVELKPDGTRSNVEDKVKKQL